MSASVACTWKSALRFSTRSVAICADTVVPITAANNRLKLDRTAAIIIPRHATPDLPAARCRRPPVTFSSRRARDAGACVRRKSSVDNRGRNSGDGNAMERGPCARRRGDAGSHPRRRLDGDARERHDGLEGEVPGRPALGRAQVRWAGNRQRLRGPRLRRHRCGRRLEPVNGDIERSAARRRVAFHAGLRETQRRLEDDRDAGYPASVTLPWTGSRYWLFLLAATNAFPCSRTMSTRLPIERLTSMR